MKQAKFTLEEAQIEFLNNFQLYGFKDKSAMVRIALQNLKKEVETRELKESADLYAELYKEDSEVKEVTESAIAEWPE